MPPVTGRNGYPVCYPSMKLILIRHGKAEDRETIAEGGNDDALRSLTPEGRRKMKAAARGLRKLYPKIDLLATSPLARAVQTAEIVYKAYGDTPQFIELDLLAGDTPPENLIAWLKDHDLGAAAVAMVGHEPSLGRWIGFFTTGGEKSFVAMKKGAVCVIDFPGPPAAGNGVLVGLFQSGDLRKIG